jgi:hypothetical protein
MEVGMAWFYQDNAALVAGAPRPLHGKKTAGACIVVVALFFGALYLEGVSVKAADALYTAFQVLFTGTVALFGIETATKG